MRKTFAILVAVATAVMVCVSGASATETDSMTVNVTGDFQYDYTYYTDENMKDQSAFDLRRARLGAETDLGVASGRLLFDFSHLDDVKVTFAYAKFNVYEDGLFSLAGGAGRLPLQFAQVASTDDYQPNMRFPIERDYGFVGNNVDGLEAAATFGSDLYNVVGQLQYHNDIGDDLSSGTDKDWNADLAVNLNKYMTVSTSYIEKTGSVEDLQAMTLWLNLGQWRIIGEHLSVGDGYNFNFNEKLDFFSVESGLKFGTEKTLEVVARIDGAAGGDITLYSAGLNWGFNDKLFLQGNVLYAPDDGEVVTGDSILQGFKDSAIATRMTLLF